MYEVELKFSAVDPAGIRARLRASGAAFTAVREQADLYFAHPSRDFAVTDEALRLRRDGDCVAITWKGPRIDAATKTRREIELPVAPATGGAAETLVRWGELLAALGFRPVREVRKQRTAVHLEWQGTVVEVAIDEVAGLGTFVELEQLATPAEVPAARDRLTALARELDCGPAERRSYLELLLDASAAR